MNPFADIKSSQDNSAPVSPFSDIPPQQGTIVKVGGIPLNTTQKQKMIQSRLNPVQNFGVGLLKGVASTAQGMAQLGYKMGTSIGLPTLSGQESLVSGSEQNKTVKDFLAPQGTAQNIGFFTEKAAEFLAPSKFVTKGQAAITGAINAGVKGTGLAAQAVRGALGVVGRAIPEAASAAAVSTVQSGGDTELAKRDAGFAALASGAFGAVGSAYRGLRQVALGNNNVSLLTKALRPTGTQAGKGWEKFKNAIPSAIDDIKATGVPVTNLQTLDEATDIAKKTVWEQVQQQIGSSGEKQEVGWKLAQAIYSTVDDNQKILLEHPEMRDDILNMAATYANAKLTTPQKQELLQQTNNFLREVYRANPSTNQVAGLSLVKQMNLKLADALRTSIDEDLEALGMTGAKELRQRYGALSELSTAVKNRIPKDERLAAYSLGDQFNMPVGIAKIIGGIKTGNVGSIIEGGAQITAGRAIKGLNKSDTLIQQVFGGTKPSTVGSRVFGAVDNASPEYRAGEAYGKNPKLGLSLEDVTKNGSDISSKITPENVAKKLNDDGIAALRALATAKNGEQFLNAKLNAISTLEGMKINPLKVDDDVLKRFAKETLAYAEKDGRKVPITVAKSAALGKNPSPAVGETAGGKTFLDRLHEGYKMSDSESMMSDAQKMSYKDFVKKYEAYNVDGGGLSKGDKPAHAVIPKDKLVPTEADSWSTFRDDFTEKYDKVKGMEEVQKYYKKEFAPPLVEDLGDGTYAVIDGHHRVANLIHDGAGDIPVYLDRRSLQRMWQEKNGKKITIDEGNSVYEELFPRFEKNKTTGKWEVPKKSASTADDALIKEARKYKSAEEFVNEFVSVPGIKPERIKKMTLFGSQAEGRATSKSDMDILVSVEDGPMNPKIIDKGKLSYMIADESYADELLKVVRKEGVVMKGNKGITKTFTRSQLTDIWKKANNK